MRSRRSTVNRAPSASPSAGLTTARAGPADFEVRRGELLGLVGLRGAGQEDIGRALFGATPHQGVVSLMARRSIFRLPT